jgi:hypothetical protein
MDNVQTAINSISGITEEYLIDDMVLRNHLDEIHLNKIFIELNIPQDSRELLTTIAEVKTYLLENA